MIRAPAQDEWITLTYANSCPGGTIVPGTRGSDGSSPAWIPACAINGSGTGEALTCSFTLEAGRVLYLAAGSPLGSTTGAGHTWSLTAE